MESCIALLQDAKTQIVEFAASLTIVGQKRVGVLLDVRIANVHQAKLPGRCANIPAILACTECYFS